MAKTTNYLAFDLGAESGRAILGTFDGERITLSEMHRFANSPVRLPDGLHWDVLRLWADIKNGIARAATQSGGVASIGVDTWGVDFALLDRQGVMLGNPYMYRDSRTDGMLEEAFRRAPRQQIFESTGIQFMQINSLFQLLSMAAGGSRVLDIAETLLFMPDLFNYWLSGRAVSEFSIATTSQCYDPRRRDWAWPILKALGIPSRIFRDVVQPGTLLGEIQPYLQEELGVGKIAVVAPACHDTGSAVVAVPAENEGFAWISSGTWAIVGTEALEPGINASTLKYNFTNEGGVNGTWRLSKNILGLWLVQECRRTWAQQGEELSYDLLTQMAAQAAPFQAVMDSDYIGFLKPGNMPERIQDYCRDTRQPVPESKGAVVRTALEALALKTRWLLERLEEVNGCCLDPVHIIGGGTKNRLLSQLIANCTGRRIITGPVEATAIGNMMMQAIALGHIASLADARAVVRASFSPEIFEPVAQDRPGWDDAYGRLLKLLESAPPSVS